MPRGAPAITYVSFDGVLQPLAYSQVVRLVIGLARRGLPYRLVSVERGTDLARADHVERTRAALASAGVDWAIVRADAMGSPVRAASAVTQVVRHAASTGHGTPPALVHARGYQGAMAARALKSRFGIPYVFDARGYWIEERVGAGQWFGSALGYAAGKLIEQQLYRAASAVVTLTALHATDLSAGIFGGADVPVETIPTCADYAEFRLHEARPAKPLGASAVPADVQRTLANKTVLAIVGALNRSYLVEHALRVARLAAETNPAVHLLVLSQQRAEYLDALRHAGYPIERATLASPDHRDMATWIHWIDWGLLLLTDSAAKRGSMPTKLGEFFAAGVRPVAYGCNAEMVAWVRRAGSGHVLDSLDDASLRSAADTIATSPVDIAVLQRARGITEPHFGLTSALDRYERLVKRVLTSR